MALENKLGITDSAELAREEERISKKRLWSFMIKVYLTDLKQVSSLLLLSYTNICLTSFTTLQAW